MINLDIHKRLEKYCIHFKDDEALQALRINFLKNKQDLEEVTCALTGIIHDGSKSWGEDGYYNGEKVEIKNTCFLGKTKLSGRVKFHDLNLNRVNEFNSGSYWLVVGCYNYQCSDPSLCEIVYGFKMDSQVSEALQSRLFNGNPDPEIGLTVYKHLLHPSNESMRIFYYSGKLTESIYSPSLYKTLHNLVHPVNLELPFIEKEIMSLCI